MQQQHTLEFGPLRPDLEVQLDNSTRWNSAWNAIKRALRLKEPIKMFIATDTELDDMDKPTEQDWDTLEAIYHGLKPFSELTLRLEGHGDSGSHGHIWEVLPALELLLTHVEAKITELQAAAGITVTLNRVRGFVPRNGRRAPRQQRANRGNRRGNQAPAQEEEADEDDQQAQMNPMLIAYQNAWEMLCKYNALTDNNHEVFAAATLLNPGLRKGFFDAFWTDDAAAEIPRMLETCRYIWENEYRQIPPVTVSAEQSPPRSAFSAFMQRIAVREAPDQADNDFERYINGRPTAMTDWKTQGLFTWWATCDFSQLRQWAFDTLSIPAMSAELERVFSQAKRFYTDDRNRVLPDSFEAAMCLKHWSQQGLYSLLDSDGRWSDILSDQ